MFVGHLAFMGCLRPHKLPHFEGIHLSCVALPRFGSVLFPQQIHYRNLMKPLWFLTDKKGRECLRPAGDPGRPPL